MWLFLSSSSVAFDPSRPTYGKPAKMGLTTEQSDLLLRNTRTQTEAEAKDYYKPRKLPKMRQKGPFFMPIRLISVMERLANKRYGNGHIQSARSPIGSLG
jgi:hypothetical protein